MANTPPEGGVLALALRGRRGGRSRPRSGRIWECTPLLSKFRFLFLGLTEGELREKSYRSSDAALRHPRSRHDGNPEPRISALPL